MTPHHQDPAYDAAASGVAVFCFDVGLPERADLCDRPLHSLLRHLPSDFIFCAGQGR